MIRDRRQGGEGDALSPALQLGLAGAPWRWHRGEPRPRSVGARASVAVHGGAVRGGRAGSRDGGLRDRSAARRGSHRMVEADRGGARGGDPRAAARTPVRMVRQAGRAQRASGLHPRRDAIPAAHLSGSPLVNAAALPAGGPPGRAIGADAAVDPGTATGDRVAAAWRALALVEDPEIPALTLVDLGIIRFVTLRPDDVLEVGLSPTYTGCPATEFIRGLVAQALAEAEVGEIAIRQVLAPAWSSDWITPEGRRKLAAYGIVPP